VPIIEPEDKSLEDLRGLHLWHGGLSSCSQRVRIVLAEKGLDWESHVVDLAAGEHAGAAYQAINPTGLVPAMVDDGAVLIESIDIIDHLDRRAPEPPLRPADAAEEAAMADWLAKADAAQGDLKLLSHEFLFQPTHKRSPERLAAFVAGHRNEALVAFQQEFNSPEGFPREKVAGAVARTDAGFRALDAALADRDWLVGGRLTLADVAWMPNIHRMALMDWPFERHPNLLRWKARIEAQPCFRKGLVEWEPSRLLDAFADYVAQRKAEGTDVRSFF
jgi:glutathione S-transferase